MKVVHTYIYFLNDQSASQNYQYNVLGISFYL